MHVNENTRFSVYINLSPLLEFICVEKVQDLCLVDTPQPPQHEGKTVKERGRHGVNMPIRMSS
jgi:hypothetical protein